VVTASHNPPEYNGYKVYRHDGCQVPPPKDKDIIDYVSRIDRYEALSPQEAQDKDLLHFLDEEMDNNYTAELAQRRFATDKGHLRIGFTPLHGTGGRLVPRLLQEFAMGEVMVVPAQKEPNGNFPTVTYPNPEESAALEELLKMGRENKLDLLMANDPDADRVGIAVWDKEKNDYVLLNGNQTGSLLAYYFLEQWQKKGLPQDAVIIKTIVTTELQREIGESFGVRVLDTLTGFKYIGDWMTHFEESGSGSYIFGGEESYGYLPEDFIRDKDGVSACYFIAEAANYYASQGKTLLDQLDEIYRKYHLYVEKLFTEKFPGQKGMQAMAAIVDQARNNPPATLAGEALATSYDIQNQQVTDLKNGQTHEDKSLPPSNVVQFTLEDGSRVTLRPSGTEPKIKFYFSVKGNIKGLSAQQAHEQEGHIRQRIQNMMEDFREQVIQKALK
jgi:phosphoglucomutase